MMEAGWLARRVARQLGLIVFSDDNRVRVWRLRGERLNPGFVLQRHTTPTASVIFTLSLYHASQWYVHDILQSHVLPLMQQLPGAIFKQDTARLTRQGCHKTVSALVTTHPWPARSPDLSPIEHIWDHLGWRVGHPTSLNELEARLQQIWNEMSQDIIQNLYA
ncbi:transposable element Tcb2 transposase [Trichonephila clavipes]|nr:transposable element Tcb2 transposase [Trichonephila clavipes]